MTDLPIPVPYAPRAPVTEDEVRALLEGVAPGGYRTSDLYPRYAVMARAAGRELVSVKALGEAIARTGLSNRTRGTGKVAVWEIGGSDART